MSWEKNDSPEQVFKKEKDGLPKTEMFSV